MTVPAMTAMNAMPHPSTSYRPTATPTAGSLALALLPPPVAEQSQRPLPHPRAEPPPPVALMSPLPPVAMVSEQPPVA